MHVSRCFCFSDINISHGSVATRLRCGEIFYDGFARTLLACDHCVSEMFVLEIQLSADLKQQCLLAK